MRLLARLRDPVVGEIAVHHCQKFVLAAAMEAEPQAETIR
jgi:hypothetical protein